MTQTLRAALRAASLVLASACASHDASTDPAIASHVDAVKAIDDHSHAEGLERATDKGYDQLRCDELATTPSTLPPAGLRFGPAQQTAMRTLYGIDFANDSASVAKLQSTAASTRKKNGDNHYTWVLEKAGIQTVLANRTAMAPELKAPLFRWVPYADALMYPLDNSALAAVNPDRKALFRMAEALEHSYLSDLGVAKIPATLDGYVQSVLQATLRRQKAAGAVAVKFEMAYLRSLAIDVVNKTVAAPIYAHYAVSGTPSAADYRALQDYLFKEIALEAGRLGMAVQFHTGAGCGESFDDNGASAMLLAPILNDPELRATRFVLLHGNRPREREIQTLITKPNVYADLSVLEYFLSTQELAQVLRPLLESMPEHVMFGTDAGPFGPGLDWEETTVMGAQQFRKALALALSQLVRDGVVTNARAMQIADQVLHDNAAALYGVK